MEAERCTDAAALCAHPTKDEPWEEGRKPIELPARGDVHEREERGLHHKNAHVEHRPEDGAVGLPGIVKTGLHKAAEEGLLGERDHQELADDKRGKVAGCAELKGVCWLMPEVEADDEGREHERGEPERKARFTQAAWQCIAQRANEAFIGMVARVNDASETDAEALSAAWLLACSTQREGKEEESRSDGRKLSEPRMKWPGEAQCSRTEKGHGVGCKDLARGIRWQGWCGWFGHACALSQNTARSLALRRLV